MVTPCDSHSAVRLARPVNNKNGLMMLAENTELTPLLIEKIKEAIDIGKQTASDVKDELESQI